jgi:hypothetical protein
VLHDDSERRLRTVAPDGVNQIRRKSDKPRSRLFGGCRKPGDGVGRMKAGVVAELFARLQVSPDPFGRRIADDVTQFEDGAICLRLDILGITKVYKQERLALENE